MIELNVNDMTCGHCVAAVTRAVKAADPQANVEVDLESKRVRVEGGRSADELIRSLSEAGYAAVPAGTRAPAAPARKGCCCS
jgi:copper chaperone